MVPTPVVRDRAELIIKELLAVKPDEQVAIVCDPQSEMVMAHALADVAVSLGAEYTILMMPARGTDQNNDLTGVIEGGLERADCLIGLTRASGAPTYSSAVKALYDAGRLRGISMVMRSLENFTSGGALADYKSLFEEGQQLAEFWRGCERIRVSSAAGTDLTGVIKDEDVIVECGYATEPGQEAAFSDGEVSQMPTEGTAQGRLVVDGPIAHLGPPEAPIQLEIEAGRVVAVEGRSSQAEELRRILAEVPEADNIAEVGIGLNPECRRNGDFEEEKKARGNVHIALGDNIFYGGSVRSPIHIDMVIYQPSVELDDHRIVGAGHLNLPGK